MKKFKIFKRIVGTTLCATMLLSVCACSQQKDVAQIEPMEAEEVHAVSFDFLGGSDVMPISGYYGPYTPEYSVDGVSVPNYISDEIFELLSECGLNLIHHANTNYQQTPESTIKMLELGEKYGIGVFVFDPRVCQAVGENALPLEELDERINRYADYPAFSGVYIVDEPGTSYFQPSLTEQRLLSNYVPVFQNLKELGIVGSGNLCPCWEENEREKYHQYVEEYISTCEPPYVSFDFYVHDSGRTKADYFYNMDVIRHYAEKYGIPFWLYIQAGGQWNDGAQQFDSSDYYPTEGQLHWNVNTALAYGTKGIQYFPTIQPYHFAYAMTNEFDFQRNGLLGAWGNKTQWWYYAKNVNEQVAAVDSVLMNAVNKGVIASGTEANADLDGKEFLMKGTSWRELANVRGNALVGCFNYQGKTALYVVNYETDYAQKVTLELQGSYNVSVIQKAEVTRCNTNVLTLDMQPGEGALVVFE